ncbi:hypothetical protein VP01_562g1 [Puccinia sorghi]|uniref:Uncharacterized protein n=1 Tax=Puccinia sorghi TaxID=27349 RepID=A0A0L6UIX5_9BASI|nr:hypothetical protein VP01_562g1 [Puccinia sorghi]
MESMRASIISSGIQKHFWHEILKSCCLSLNQIPRKGKDKSPWEIVHGRLFPGELLKSIGTPAVILNMMKVKGRKLDLKGEEGMLVGFNVALWSYCIITRFGKVIETKHVKFLKKSILASTTSINLDSPLKLAPEDKPLPEPAHTQIPENAASSDNGESNSDQEETTDPEEESEVKKQLVQTNKDITPEPPPISTRVLRLGLKGFLVGPGNNFKKEFESCFKNSSCHDPNTILGMNTLIPWNSSKQQSITYSSTEAELNPLLDSFHKGIWLKALLAEIWDIQIDSANHFIDSPEIEDRLMMSDNEFKEKFCNKHLIDNKGLDDKVTKFESNPKIWHIDLKMKGRRQEVKHQNIRITLIRTSDMVADALTKPASRSSIENLTNCIDSDTRLQ